MLFPKFTKLAAAVVTATALSLTAFNASATIRCDSANLLGTKLITDICWRCIFPMKLAGATVSPFAVSKPADSSSSSSGSSSSKKNQTSKTKTAGVALDGEDLSSEAGGAGSEAADDKSIKDQINDKVSEWAGDLGEWLGSGIREALGDGEEVPADAAKQPLCMCFDDVGMPEPGFVTSFWEPYRLVEFETVPGCLSSLNGTKLNINPGNLGTHAGSPGGETDKVRFNHYHYYAFPLVHMLELFSGKGCNPGGYSDFDLMYISEIDPTWSTPEVSFFSNPEAALFANPAADIACMPDALSSAVNKPIESLFWCAGTWGLIYPLSGAQNERLGILRGTSLATIRVLTQIHRRGFAYGTMGEDAMCEGKIAPYYPKGQYKFTMVWPTAETQRSHKIGTLVETWGSGKLVPGDSEEPIYLIYRWLDCCNRF